MENFWQEAGKNIGLEMDKLVWLLAVSPRGNPACRGTFGGRRKAVRDRLALQGGTGDFP